MIATLWKRLPLFVYLLTALLLFGSPPSSALPLSGAGADEPEANTELSKTLFPGKATYRTVTENDRHYFSIEAKTELPPLTRVKTELYYVRGEPPIDYLAHRKTVRVNENGRIQTRVLGLRRTIWAGTYRLVFTLKPSDQVPEVRKKLNRVDEAVRRSQTWFHGTKKKLKRQKKEALEAARRDLTAVLNLAGDLKQTFTSFIRRRKQIDGSLPGFAYLDLARDWLEWSGEWRKRLAEVKRNNRKRPRFNNRTISFFFAEDRTAYFLKYDLQKIQELYDLAKRELWSSSRSPASARRFREKYRNLRSSVSNTMIFLNLVVPMEEQARDAFRQDLNRIRNRFREIRSLLTGESGSTEKNADWRGRVQSKINAVLTVLLKQDPDLPDLIYRRFLELTRQLNRFSTGLSGRKRPEAEKRFRSIMKEFRTLRKTSESMLKAME